jgi:hypothetical protein
LNEGIILEEGTPEKIAGSQKAREIYLGDGFQLSGNRQMRPQRSKAEKNAETAEQRTAQD